MLGECSEEGAENSPWFKRIGSTDLCSSEVFQTIKIRAKTGFDKV